MRAYVFVCSNETEKECFDRMLVGGNKGYVRAGQVKKGDSILLYNFQTGKMHGIFQADSESTVHIVPEAWKGKYEMQVRVSWSKEYIPLTRPSFSDFIRFGRSNLPLKSLSEEQYFQLIEKFEADERIAYTERDYRENNPGPIFTNDGHRVRSQAEEKIDNWLYAHNICHAYDKPLLDSVNMADFYIPQDDLYIEFWGMNTETYLENKKHKIEMYKENHLKLFEIYSKDVKNLEEILQQEIGCADSG